MGGGDRAVTGNLISVTVYKRKDRKRNPYWLSYRLPSGERIRKPASHREDYANVKARELEAELNRGNFDPALLTVGGFVESFLVTLKASRSERHYKGCVRTLGLFAQRYGHLCLLDVTPGHAQEFMSTRGHLAAATQARELRELKACFSTAVKWGYLAHNPCAPVRTPRVPRNKPEIPAAADVGRLLEIARDTPFYALLATAAYTGLRRGELASLEWSDVALDRRVLRVRNKPGHPVKDYEERAVPIPDALWRILPRVWWDSPREGWAFPSPKGARWDVNNLSKKLRPIFRAAGLAGGLHQLRHAYASRLAMSGADLPAIQKLLGHANIQTTMIYADVTEEHLKEQAAKLSY